jgi:hypothetical protein
LHSGFRGDEYCLRPPPPERGVQLHFGPRSYLDPAELQPYLVQPGQELTSYAVLNVPISAPRQMAYVKLSMRPGSHHLISMLVTGKLQPGFVEPSADCGGRLLTSFPSTTLPILESPPQGVPAPENEGLARDLPADTSLCLDYHRYNDSQAPIVSEAWVNVWFAEPSAVTQRSFDMVMNAGPFEPLAAHARRTLTAVSEVSGDGRILTLFGHRHAATGRFAVFLNELLIYDSYDWSEPRRYEYDSLTTNPRLDADKRLDGAASGVLAVHSGDRLRVACDSYNASTSAMSFGSDLRAQEMCVLFISAVGVAVNPLTL